jgi:hypothetical protein
VEGKVMPSAVGLIFTIDVDGKPTFIFDAQQLREVSQLCGEE